MEPGKDELQEAASRLGNEQPPQVEPLINLVLPSELSKVPDTEGIDSASDFNPWIGFFSSVASLCLLAEVFHA